MATGTPSNNAAISNSSVEILPAKTGRLQYTVTNLSAVVMFMCRDSAAEINKGIPLIQNTPVTITADPDRTGDDNPIMKLSVNVIAATAGAYTVCWEEINR